MSERMSDEDFDRLMGKYIEPGSLAWKLRKALNAERRILPVALCRCADPIRCELKQRAEAAEAKLEAVAELPEKWLDDCMNYRCTSKCSNKKCADELLEALLEQTK